MTSTLAARRAAPETNAPIRFLAEQAFSRAAGAPLIADNAVRLLKDATENYPAWLAAIDAAERTILFENYIFKDDAAGSAFAEALARRARAGVQVRVLYDWLGSLGTRRVWRELAAAGVEVRAFNPPRLDSPLGWLSRDHRKTVSVDGRAAFVSGLCVGKEWVGDPARGVPPWRDTGIELRGPAVAAVERAFAQTWAECGPPISLAELATDDGQEPAGDVSLRVIASTPYTAGIYRLDQLIAAVARRTLWITDAYFVGTTPYVQALRAAAQDGVDVRLLVPGGSDVPILKPLSRAGYRPLLEGGVRVYEWNGPMLHAKTAVADELWARVGSSNLNIASWIGNWELDVAIEDAGFGAAMARQYVADLRDATEIVLDARLRVRAPAGRRRPVVRSTAGGSARRAAAGALRIGNTVGAAIANRRVLGPAEARLTAGAGGTLLLLALVALLWPPAVAVPLALVFAWVAVGLLVKASRLRSARRADTRDV
jgi:cardiolipin synthase